MSRPKSPPPLHRELHRWYDTRFGYWVAVDTSGRVCSWEPRVGWLDDFESYGAKALQRVSRLLAKERKT